VIMKTKRKYSWVFRYCDVLNGKACYRLYHKLTVDDVDFLADKFCKANSDYRLDVFRLRLRKRNASG
jgi:hypothetical protein